jgi:hypothetical protein
MVEIASLSVVRMVSVQESPCSAGSAEFTLDRLIKGCIAAIE